MLSRQYTRFAGVCGSRGHNWKSAHKRWLMAEMWRSLLSVMMEVFVKISAVSDVGVCEAICCQWWWRCLWRSLLSLTVELFVKISAVIDSGGVCNDLCCHWQWIHKDICCHWWWNWIPVAVMYRLFRPDIAVCSNSSFSWDLSRLLWQQMLLGLVMPYTLVSWNNVWFPRAFT